MKTLKSIPEMPKLCMFICLCSGLFAEILLLFHSHPILVLLSVYCFGLAGVIVIAETVYPVGRNK